MRTAGARDQHYWSLEVHDDRNEKFAVPLFVFEVYVPGYRGTDLRSA
jgi:mannose-6-phosphate isomerase-like protein (cupin superfamily)